MEIYYTLLLTLILMFQNTVKGFTVNLICIISTILRSYGLYYLDSIGAGFFEAAIYVECVIITLCIVTLPIHKSALLVFIVNVSLMLNLYLGLESQGNVVFFIHDHSGTINIILFEALVYVCFIRTLLYPKVKTLFGKSVDYVSRINNTPLF